MSKERIVVINKFKSDTEQERQQKIKELLVRYVAKEFLGSSYFQSNVAKAAASDT